MPVSQSELKYYLTSTTPSGSLGGNKGTALNEITTLNSIFRDITGAESTSGIVLYRCLCLVNEDTETITLQNTKLWVSQQPINGMSIQLAADPSTVTSSVTIPNETTNPTTLNAAISFQSTTAYSDGILFPVGTGSLLPNTNYFFWIKLTVPSGTVSTAGASARWKVGGDTL